jgi:hypothetical protein
MVLDPDAADKFIESYCVQRHQEGTTSGTKNDESIASTSSSENIWCNKRPTHNDQEATTVFLQLRENASEKFNDKKTIKNALWQKILTEMEQRVSS